VNIISTEAFLILIDSLCSNFEFPLITKNGVRIEVLLNASTRRDGQGNVIGVVGIGQDITARLAQEREYSKLIDTANAPIFGVGVDVSLDWSIDPIIPEKSHSYLSPKNTGTC
jgi:hypothetical protein